MIPFFISFVSSRRSAESIESAWKELIRLYPGEQHKLDLIDSIEAWEKWLETHPVPDNLKTLWVEKHRLVGIAPDENQTKRDEQSSKEKDEEEKERKIKHPTENSDQINLNKLEHLRELQKQGIKLSEGEKAELKYLEEHEGLIRERAEEFNKVMELQKQQSASRMQAISSLFGRKPPQQPQTQAPSKQSAQRGPAGPRIPNIPRVPRISRNFLKDLRKIRWLFLIPWWFWLILLLFAIIILMFVMIMGFLGGGGTPGGGKQGPAPSGTPTELSIDIVSNKPRVENGESIIFTITAANNTSQTVSVEVDGQRSVNAEIKIPESTVGIENVQASYFDWILTDIPAGGSKQLTLTLKPTQDDTPVTVTVSIKYAPGFVTLPPSSTASSDNCNGSYDLSKTNGLNFGDASCELSGSLVDRKNKIYNFLSSQDPNLADVWFSFIIPGESVPAYNPNSHSTQADIGSPDPNGVWGLFSMGDGTSSNGLYDNGKTNWQQQIINAIQYNNTRLIPNGKTLCAYWDAARRTAQCKP